MGANPPATICSLDAPQVQTIFSQSASLVVEETQRSAKQVSAATLT